MSWPQAALGDVVRIARSGVAPEEIRGGTTYVGLEHIDSSGGFVEVKSVDAGELASSKFNFTSQHVLFGKLRPYLRKTARPNFDGVCSTDILPLEPTKKIDRDYLFHVLRRQSFVDDVSSLCAGANLPRISPKVLASMWIPVPPVDEQRRIAAILDKADALRAKRREAIVKLDQLLQSVFIDIFGDPIANPKEWPKRELQSVCERVIDCPHSTPTWSDHGVICLRTPNLLKGNWDWSDTRYVSEVECAERTKRSEIAEGDIILSREGTVGVAAIVERGMKLCMGQRLVQVRVDRKTLLPLFLLHLLLHDLAPERIGRLMVGSTAKHLNVKDLKSLTIPVPPMSLQKSFDRAFASIGALKSSFVNSAASSQAMFFALQKQAFSGEL